MKISCILFDLDGTLIDTNDLIIKSFQHTYKTHLGLDIPPEEIVPTFGAPLITTLAKVAKGREEEFVKTYRAFNLSRHDDLCAEFPGTAETLRVLQGKGIALGVVTSKMRSLALRGMRLLNLEHFFQVLVACEDVTCHKPEGEPILKALEKLNRGREGVLYVGDSPIDIQCARNAGVISAAVMWSACGRNRLSEARPDIMLETISDLVKLV